MLNEDSLERELSCGICFELYTIPLQLPCMHTFCKDCLKDIIKCSKNKRLKCPDCRRNVDLGKMGIESLKRNFKLASIVEIYRQASEKLSADNEESKKLEAAVRAPSPVEKDYEFLSNILQSSQENANSPFEPHIIDDLWGTFKRTTRKGSRPPAPLPVRPQPVGKSSTPPSVRPLPPIPRPLSRDLPHRPLPPSPPTLEGNEGNEYTPFFSDVSPVIPSAPPPEHSPEPSSPSYFTLEQGQTDESLVELEGDPQDDDWVDITSLVHQTPLPSRASLPSQPTIPPLPPRRLCSTSVIDPNATRPPIPVPRTKLKGAPILPKRNSSERAQKGNTMDSLAHRPPPPVPREKRS